MSSVPELRIAAGNSRPVRREGDFVLYWMIACRRATWNFSLQRAVEWAVELRRPLVVLEPLRLGYPWASDRLHRFVIDGMADNLRRCDRPGVTYYPYVEPGPDAGRGLLAALAQRACVIVTDDFPSFFLPRMVRAAAAQVDIRLEQVDANGLLPLRATRQVFTTARSFRAYLQKQLAPHLEELPEADPLKRLSRRRLPSPARLLEKVRRQWPAASAALLRGEGIDALPLDHRVAFSPIRGGATAAEKALQQFLDRRMAHYIEQGNDPDEEVRSGLSPYLHFGHISPHAVFWRIAQRERWAPDRIVRSGGRRGWWGMSAAAEAFLDELVTWRELGYNMSSHRDDYDQYESLPAWAQDTLRQHERDPRRWLYTLPQWESADTHDRLWNAAQNQLRREGRMHNYLRMLWGKKILEWSASPREALATMIELNNKYALDGRDPNSYSGIFWVLGRYDRAWGPERPIFGKVRYMSSDNTLRKVAAKRYLERYAADSSE